MDGWLNLYKPKGISSAKAVSLVKRVFRDDKIGHTGTLDLEAEGTLPIAIGQATKLASILVDAKKQYFFKVKFGAKTDTADAAGKIVDQCSYIPTQEECINVCWKFIGEIEQIPPAYSALKINGIRSYKLARENRATVLKPRKITIYDLKCLNYDSAKGTASFITDCSKGTYIRTLAENISLSLQSLGFVLELRRKKVGIFSEEESVDITNFMQADLTQADKQLLIDKCLNMEDVLGDIPVIEVRDSTIARKISFGQKCQFDVTENYGLAWIRYNKRVIAIGSLYEKLFKLSRVFNYKNGE